MTKKTKERIERELTKVGLDAVLEHAKAKLFAKVNCEDNFALAMKMVAHDAIMDDVAGVLDKDDVEWFNEMCKRQVGINTLPFDKFVLDICRKAYQTLKA